MTLKWNFRSGVGGGGVWIFSRTTHCRNKVNGVVVVVDSKSLGHPLPFLRM